MPNASRRSILQGAAAPLLASSGMLAANDQPTYGLIATGSRGRGLHGAFQKLGARCLALCDVYEPHLERARQMTPGNVKTYADYHALLDLKDLDFVVIASPDHHHRPMLEAALAAGKDVYLEKPLSMSLEESQAMIRAVRKTNRVVQIGMQRRSMGFIRQAKKVIDDGRLGPIVMVQAAWNWRFDMPLSNAPLEGKLDWERFLGAAPRRALEPRRFRWWRGFWDYSGGNITDQGTHLMDVVQWMTGSGAPVSATCQGQVVRAPGAEVPNVFSAVYEYPNFLATWTLNYRTTHNFDWSITFLGEEATMFMDRRGYKIYRSGPLTPEPWLWKGAPEVIEEVPDADRPEAHQQNFLECIRSRREPNCPIEVAAAAVAGPHMANLALRQGRKVRLGQDGLAVSESN
jgi:predicted dehydrogenase